MEMKRNETARALLVQQNHINMLSLLSQVISELRGARGKILCYSLAEACQAEL